MLLASLCAYMIKHLLTALVGRYLENVSEFKLQIRLPAGWLIDFLRKLMNRKIDAIKTMIKTLIKASNDYKLNRQHLSKTLRCATYDSVINLLSPNQDVEPKLELFYEA